MNEKEVGELRRRFRSEKTAITHIHGCYVDERREIISEFDQSLAMMNEDEQDRFLTLLRKTLSGTIGRNLVDLSFETQEVVSGEAHRRLMALRDCKLQDEALRRSFYETVSQSLSLDTGYLILLACDAYDVPHRGRDDLALEDASEEVYTYILCSICPVKQAKPGLSYDRQENAFRGRVLDWLVGAPELGFLFPAFTGRSTDLYAALYYTRNVALCQEALIQALFHTEAPMPAAAQKENFQAVLEQGLGAECRLEVVQAVQEHFCDLMEEHKALHEREPLTVSRGEVRRVLEHCGVDGEHVAAFEAAYDETFGAQAELPPRNLVEPNRCELSTPDVTIRVDPARRDLIETREIDGVRYLLIRADGGVELNGVPVQL